jgi:hypothetical protein
MRLRSAARQRLRESLVSSIAQFPHQNLPQCSRVAGTPGFINL